MSHIPEQSAADSLAKGLLEVRRLKARYGPIEVLHGLALSVDKGQLVSLVGANGAGKTTLLRVLSGVHPASEGTVMFGGQDISRVSSHARVSLGICQAPEGRQVFGPMSVEDNLLLGAYRRRNAQLSERMEQVYLLFPVLKEKRRLLAGTLSGGQQQMLAIARALMSSPKVLLVDEPSVGLSPLLVSHTITKIRELKEKYQLTVLMAEQNFNQAIRIADHGYIIVHGEIVFQGDVETVKNNELVKSFYLGVAA